MECYFFTNSADLSFPVSYSQYKSSEKPYAKNFVFSFQITRCFIKRDIPIRANIPKPILYLSIFGSSSVSMSRTFDYICTVKHEVIPMILRSLKQLQEDNNDVGHKVASNQLEDVNDINEVAKDALAILGTEKYLTRGESIFRRDWTIDEEFVRQNLDLTSHPAFFSYVIKYLKNDQIADYSSLEDKESRAFSAFFNSLRKHVPRVTEFIDTFQSRVDKYDAHSQGSQELSVDGSATTSGIGSWRSGPQGKPRSPKKQLRKSGTRR